MTLIDLLLACIFGMVIYGFAMGIDALWKDRQREQARKVREGEWE